MAVDPREQKDLTLLKEEYSQLQDITEKFDGRILTIKQWSITTSMAGIAYGVANDEPLLYLLSAAASCLFWWVEILWKSFQTANYYRLRRIEQYLNGAHFDNFRYPYMTHAWSHGWRKHTSFKKIITWPHVYVPHVFVIFLGIVLWTVDDRGGGFTLRGEAEQNTLKVSGLVGKVRDGDTIEVGPFPIRLNGISAPEVNEPLGQESKALMTDLVMNKELRCELNGEMSHDRYVGTCYLDNRDVGEVIVGAGLALDCPRFSDGRYKQFEDNKHAILLPEYCK